MSLDAIIYRTWRLQAVNSLKGLIESIENPNDRFAPKPESVRTAVETLLTFTVGDKPMGFHRRNPYYEKGDEDAPFFSEAFLYPLLGKEDARTLLARVYLLCVALGFTRSEFDAMIDKASAAARRKRR